MLTKEKFYALREKTDKYFNAILPHSLGSYDDSFMGMPAVKHIQAHVEKMHLEFHLKNIPFENTKQMHDMVGEYRYGSLFRLITDGSESVIGGERVPADWKSAVLEAFVNWNKVAFINKYFTPKIKYRVIPKTLLKKLFIPPFPIEAGNNTLYMNYLVSEGFK